MSESLSTPHRVVIGGLNDTATRYTANERLGIEWENEYGDFVSTGVTKEVTTTDATYTVDITDAIAMCLEENTGIIVHTDDAVTWPSVYRSENTLTVQTTGGPVVVDYFAQDKPGGGQSGVTFGLGESTGIFTSTFVIPWLVKWDLAGAGVTQANYVSAELEFRMSTVHAPTTLKFDYLDPPYMVTDPAEIGVAEAGMRGTMSEADLATYLNGLGGANGYFNVGDGNGDSYVVSFQSTSPQNLGAVARPEFGGIPFWRLRNWDGVNMASVCIGTHALPASVTEIYFAITMIAERSVAVGVQQGVKLPGVAYSPYVAPGLFEHLLHQKSGSVACGAYYLGTHHYDQDSWDNPIYGGQGVAWTKHATDLCILHDRAYTHEYHVIFNDLGVANGTKEVRCEGVLLPQLCQYGTANIRGSNASVIIDLVPFKIFSGGADAENVANAEWQIGPLAYSTVGWIGPMVRTS